MDAAKFSGIITQLDKLIAECEECKISSSAEFDQLKICDVRILVEKAKKAKSNMDKVLQVELYHVIGMGNLSAAQEVQLCGRIRTYSGYRRYIQALCGYDLPATPKIPPKTDYNCQVLKINLNKKLQS